MPCPHASHDRHIFRRLRPHRIPAAKAGIAVTNTPDVLTDATADIAMLLMLGAARGAYWGERMVREENWGAWSHTSARP